MLNWWLHNTSKTLWIFICKAYLLSQIEGKQGFFFFLWFANTKGTLSRNKLPLLIGSNRTLFLFIEDNLSTVLVLGTFDVQNQVWIRMSVDVTICIKSPRLIQVAFICLFCIILNDVCYWKKKLNSLVYSLAAILPFFSILFPLTSSTFSLLTLTK